jgi:hypothetical protein
VKTETITTLASMSLQSEKAYYYLGMAASVAFFGYLGWSYFRARKMKPRFEPAEVVFQERGASGCSQKNIHTRLGGARNCLWLVVTGSFLWVTSSFPFSLFTSFYDLEHVIPLDSILSVRRSSFLGRSSFLLTYRDGTGDRHTLRLLPKKTDDFVRSLGVKIEHETSA